MMVTERCPICGATGEVTDVGAFGYVAHCGDCYDLDPEAPEWRHLQWHGETPELAVEGWLEEGREFCAIDEIPHLPCSYLPKRWITAAVREQCVLELARQREIGAHLIDITMFEIVDGERVERDFKYLETNQ